MPAIPPASKKKNKRKNNSLKNLTVPLLLPLVFFTVPFQKFRKIKRGKGRGGNGVSRAQRTLVSEAEMVVREEGGQVMGIVTKTIDFSVPHPLTDEEKQMIKKAASMPVTFDEDCPESTDEMLTKFRKAGKNR